MPARKIAPQERQLDQFLDRYAPEIARSARQALTHLRGHLKPA